MKIGIIGAGMAGITCGLRLQDAGHSVILFDKGRGPGGRMSSRRVLTPLGEVSFDHGAQYFTARDPDFRAQVQSWADASIVAPWPSAGPEAWVGTPVMNAPVRETAARLNVRWEDRVDTVRQAAGQWQLNSEAATSSGFDGLVIALPAEQAAVLLATIDPAMTDLAIDAPSLPCWTMMAAFAERLPIAADSLRDIGPIGWAARNSAKPARGDIECWVVQASPNWSTHHLEDDSQDVAYALLTALSHETGQSLPTPVSLTAHRWRFAKSGSAKSGPIWNPELNLGLCGDWLLGPRVECAWLSGQRLADAIDGAAASSLV